MKIVVCWVIILTSILSGCAPILRNTSFDSCQQKCRTHLNECVLQCRNNCPYCSNYAQSKAQKSYINYLHEEFVKGGYIIRDLQSYRDPLQCRKITCDCASDYNLCMQSCGSKIIYKVLQPAPIC